MTDQVPKIQVLLWKYHGDGLRGRWQLACTAKIRKIIKYMQKIWQKSPNEFARKAGIELLNEIRLSEGEAQESIMS